MIRYRCKGPVLAFGGMAVEGARPQPDPNQPVAVLAFRQTGNCPRVEAGAERDNDAFAVRQTQVLLPGRGLRPRSRDKFDVPPVAGQKFQSPVQRPRNRRRTPMRRIMDGYPQDDLPALSMANENPTALA